MTLISDLAEEFAPLETGGMLCGYISQLDGSREAVIKELIGSGPDALHGRQRFVPDGPWQRHQLAAVFEASGGQTTYLGDWHSHPRGGSSPSPQDGKTARGIANHRKARTPTPLMAIMHGRAGHWKLAAHCYRKRAFHDVQVESFQAR